ncbi:voltage-gated sodium channel [Sulfitobacter delicatus]|uniref:Voltage-gated sodium channel n=2 Tax=Sulfitobacter delicatus TaxID=218672 RepID=A0A1G7P244_9RHOB|nr:voltage-gated sodium channel [Sulfitobacter delicatus]
MAGVMRSFGSASRPKKTKLKPAPTLHFCARARGFAADCCCAVDPLLRSRTRHPISTRMTDLSQTAPTSPRRRIARFVERNAVQNFILAVILFNAVILGLETSDAVMAEVGPLILVLDRICLTIFVVEIALKLYAHGTDFFRRGWNLFDFVIVGISLIPATQSLSVLRALRILRLLRVVSVAPSLRRVVEGLVNALPGMGSVFLLMGVIFYIGSVMATKLFGATFPDWFGTLGRSGYSLFQIMTLESWSMGIVRPVMEVYPYAWMFFVPFIVVTTFAVVNLLVGLIVNSMQDAHHEETNAKTDDYRDEVLARLNDLESLIKSHNTPPKP